MLNLVELTSDDSYTSPCKHGSIVPGHACYCHADVEDAPRKCPIWRNFGEYNLKKWHNQGDWDSIDWNGGCKDFEENTGQ